MMIASAPGMLKLSLRSSAFVAALFLAVVPDLITSEGPRAADSPGPYVLTDLGTLGGLSAQAYDINEAGDIVGYSTNSALKGRAFLWSNGSMTDLGTLGAGHSDAQAISDTGYIAGRSGTSASKTHAALWAGGTTTDLTPASDYAVANGVNDIGQVVGTMNHWIGFLWQNGALTNLGQLGGGCTHAADINDAGQIVGSSCSTHVTELGPMQHAFLWQNGVMLDLGILPGEEDSGASAINNVGQIVGSSGRTDPQTYEITSRAFLYENGVMSPLPVPSWESYAGDVNDSGVIVGTMRAAGGASNYHAYIYADGVVTNLNSLVPPGSGLHLAYASAINNAGQIVGTAFDAQGRYHAFLLTPAASDTPVVSIGDAMVTEGHAGTRTVSVTLSLSTPAGQPITVSYGTVNASAVAGSDYEAASDTATFNPGETSKAISLSVNGDRSGEPNETFLVNLSQAQGRAVIADGQGVVTIADDEPRLAINDVSKNEGNSGTAQLTFTVTLSPSPEATVTVSFATANGSATSVEDYNALSGSLAFSAGQTTKTLSVTVKGDRKREANEVFYVNLAGATGALISDSRGDGVIRNDDK